MPTDLPAFDHARPIGIVDAGVMDAKIARACARAGLTTRLFDVDDGKAHDSQARSAMPGSVSRTCPNACR